MGRGHIYEILVLHGKTAPIGLQTIWSSTDDPNNRMRGSLHEALERVELCHRVGNRRARSHHEAASGPLLVEPKRFDVEVPRRL